MTATHPLMIDRPLKQYDTSQEVNTANQVNDGARQQNMITAVESK